MHRATGTLLLLVLVSLPLQAEAQSPGDFHAEYAVYTDGLHIAQVSVQANLTSSGYRIALHTETVGFFSFLKRGYSDSSAFGYFTPSGVAPQHFEFQSLWSGTLRQAVIDYREGFPLVRLLVPDDTAEREPVPGEWRAGSIDSLSAVALLVHHLAHTGRCDGESRTFEGRMVFVISARTVGETVLTTTARSPFAGAALRCDFEGRVLAGFLRHRAQEEAEQSQHGSAWFATVLPNLPPVPIRLAFDMHWAGDAVFYLTTLQQSRTEQAPTLEARHIPKPDPNPDPPGPAAPAPDRPARAPR
jgi:hypothetical protein